ncbi:MAG: hypothetical protein LQ350_002858 [Teloschistes chrysophthalmus]|nr:MAG: hypothetical protein LQ350_002858 [Niorma chrysophthalma]
MATEWYFYTDIFDLLEISQPLPSAYSKCSFLHYLHQSNLLFDVDTDSDTTDDDFQDIPTFFHGEFKNTDDGFQTFFTRYETLQKAAAGRCRALEECTYRHLFNAVDILRTQHQHRLALVSLLEQWLERSTELRHLEAFRIRSIASTLLNLAASLLSLTVVSNPFERIFDDSVPWDGLDHFLSTPDDADNSYIGRQFPPPTSLNSVKLPQSFTAAHLEQTAGIRIRWTHNLAHHLLLRDDDTTLMLFHHVSALHHHIRTNKVLPTGLAEETIRTMSLLLPPSLGEPNLWFRQEQQRHSLDVQAGSCARLNSSERQTDKFHYWRDRLVLLKRTYDEAEPKKLGQL